ncbi:Pls/PosA family non-ribosomal peptide synthetase [Embleya scabrispora]|uniref:Pls/PosA family non-ribosomal peptide synthetase n=1 Tax=Embleya scabrispora TaxID=159449 RepID=UPI000A311020|nr:Pls/PosA family non-ribosomal peptide synthetase [Embleya scabrispora]MYS87509.1 amino acid adenylation domain-containing protein [Streptomyces sp. SID5474]
MHLYDPPPHLGEPSAGPAVYHGAAAPASRTLLDILDATVENHPHAPALDTGSEVFDYRRLRAEVEHRARRLAAHGIGPGDRVGIRIPSGTAELYLSILAALRSGAGYVPVDAEDPDERAATLFREAGVHAVLTGEPDPTPTATRPAGSGTEPRPPTPDDIAWIIFTSGSTGAPKGVAVTHRSAAAFVDAEARLFLPQRPLGPGDRVLAGLSVAFDASCEEMWLAWRSGACLVPAPRALVRAGPELGPWLVERGITAVSTVPTLAALWPDEALAAVRLLIVGGEVCPAELVARFAAAPEREMWNTYGPTETTVVACATRLRPHRPVRIGLPLAGWRLAVADETGRPVPWGAEGELLIAGVGAARYLDPARDADRFRPCAALETERAYRTGDLVRADPEGLVFLGRADDQVKVGGRRIELGEIDAALGALPGVLGAAATVRQTPGGGAVLVGYVVPDRTSGGPGFDPVQARLQLAERLPWSLVPVLAEIDALPTRTSGKVDRDALPWPPAAPAGTGERLDGTVGRLAEDWAGLLGVRPDADADFFALGGTSLAAARLASTLRERHPGLSVADLYRHPTLAGMAAHLDASAHPEPGTRRIRPVPRRVGGYQFLVQIGLYGILGLRALVALAAADNVIAMIGAETWAPYTSWWLVLLGWFVLCAAPARLAIGAGAARALTRDVRPGEYPRGGSVHLRLWTAERIVAAFGVRALLGTPWAAVYARALGCRVGRDVALHALPPVTGLGTFGDGCGVEREADVSGWWLDGDRLRIGGVRVGAGARVGHRSTLQPGAVLGRGAELASGACLAGVVPAGESWAGSPARAAGPAERPPPRVVAPSRWWRLAYSLGLAVPSVLAFTAAVPVLIGAYRLVRDCPTLTEATMRLLPAAPVFALVGLLCWLFVLTATVRLLGRGIRPGLHPQFGPVAWRAWLVTRLLDGSRASLFPLYASLATPVWLRLLGARVGRGAEISTVLALPSLTRIEDGAFLADDTLVAPYELRGGWLRLDTVRIGRRAFVGNSGIVAGGREVPEHGLIGVLSDAPAHSEPGSSWLGRPAMSLPRVAVPADPGRTFAPSRRLVAARIAVELCRLLPLVCALVLAEAVVLAQQRAFDAGGLGLAALVGAPVLLAAAVVAASIATAAKWLLVGRFRVAEYPLWSSFVWRNELYDVFVESLAVPWMARSFLGTPMLNWWLRSLGARIGRGVWCDTYWLPESDLVRLGDGAGVDRGCVLQTHLFHDRIMRLDTVELGAGASLGPHAVVLPGTLVAAHASIGPASLVMRGETIPAGTRWAGNPVAGEHGE